MFCLLGDSSDLASVNRILESANSHHFQSFLLRESGSITNEIMRNRLNLLRSVNPDRSREERPLEPRPDSNESASRPRPEDPSDSRDGQEMPTMMDIGDLPKQVISHMYSNCLLLHPAVNLTLYRDWSG